MGMTEAKHDTAHWWYLRRRGQIEGPFPAAQITDGLLLGRILAEDELSSDLVHWYRADTIPELYPAVIEAAKHDPQARQRLAAAQRWADERRGEDRRRYQSAVVRDRRSLPERRQRSTVNPRPRHEPHRAAGVLSSRKPSPFGGVVVGGPGRSRLLLSMMVMLAALVMWVLVEPGRPPAQAVDCEAPPRPGVDLSNCFLEGAIYRNADLTGARFYNTRLSGSDLRGVLLAGAEMSYAELSVARLQGADLHEATLVGASLRGSDLRQADLRRANLAYADLRGARLEGAVLEGALLDRAIWVDGRTCAPASIGQCILQQPPAAVRSARQPDVRAGE